MCTHIEIVNFKMFNIPLTFNIIYRFVGALCHWILYGNYADIKFSTPKVKFVFNHWKTYCNATIFFSGLTQKLFGRMNCNFENKI